MKIAIPKSKRSEIDHRLEQFPDLKYSYRNLHCEGHNMDYNYYNQAYITPSLIHFLKMIDAIEIL